MNVYMFQKDLRIHDQPLLKKCLENGPTIGLFIIEPYQLEFTTYGFLKRGLKQRKFMHESLVDLRVQLANYHIPFLTVIGNVEDIFNTLKMYITIENIYYETLLGSEENIFYQKLNHLGIKTYTETFHSLYHINDIPFNENNIPKTFTSFRKTIETLDCIRKPVAIQPQNPLNISLPDWWVTAQELSIEHVQSYYLGGETEALKRLDYYFFKSKKVSTYKLTRNGMLEKDDSTKFSPYLAWGNLSPRLIYDALKKFEKNHTKNESTYWVYFELLWRDYFYFVHHAYKNLVFSSCGLKAHCTVKTNDHFIQSWLNAKTGFPLIDANIRELTQTGFMSNRGRQNVANFFTKQLNQDWRIGAAFFESYLIDYDVSSNTLNWLYTSGLGNDPREDRIFNVITQGKRYDENGEYVAHFIPEIAHIESKKRYDIPYFNDHERAIYNLTSYPKPMIQPWGKR